MIGSVLSHYQITDKLNVTAGLRWLMDDKKGSETMQWAGMYDYDAEARYTQAQIDFLEATYGITTHGADFLDSGPLLVGDPIEQARFYWFGDLNPCGGACDKPTGSWWGAVPPDERQTLRADWDAWVGKLSFDYKPS
jgi:hypothetical protein